MDRSFFYALMLMFLKGIYAGKPALFQLLILLLFILAGGLFASMSVMGIFHLIYGLSANIMHYPDMMRLLQLFSAIGTFLLPALALAWTCSNTPWQYLFCKNIPGIQILLITLISMFLLSPAISLTSLLNKQMVLPEFMAPVEQWMQEQEATAEQLTGLLLAGKGFFTLLFNLVVIAAAAGITEEFLFRGALQRIIGGWTQNHHIIIWSAAFLFSAFHMQFYGFLPRMILGAYFGYLLFWSKNIWLPVFAHFINNAFAVISLSDSKLKENQFITGEVTGNQILPYTIAACVALLLFYICIRKLRFLLRTEK